VEKDLEHESTFALMMDALDGELSNVNRLTLESHLQTCPDCQREWLALVAIDTLFRQTPAISPAAGFTQRTLARLPNRKARMWAISTVYGLLLLSGIIPVLLIGLFITRFGQFLTQPALVESVLDSLRNVAQIFGTVLTALLNGVGQFVINQPTVIGWLLVMVGIVFVWGGVYRQLLGQPQNRLVRREN